MRLKLPRGFTFNELLVAMNLVAVAVLGYSLSSGDVIRRQTVASNQTVAINLAQDKLEELQARKNLADVSLCPNGGENGISAHAGAAGIFSRCWTVGPSSLAANLKRIDVKVTWLDHSNHQVNLSTLIYTGD